MSEYALEITGLKKVYDNDVEALKGIDLKITKGDFFALLGPNGAGKSSTIGIISSITNKTDGNIKIFGVDIDQNFPKAKSFLGVVAQEINFSQFEKVEDIVITQAGFYGIPKDIAKARCKNLLKKLSLWDKRQDQARNLSGGQKRRLMIAKALVHEPKLLILDEPTAGVDIELRREMWDFLSDINKKGTTIILTTHYLEEAEQHCNNIAIIDEGSIVEDTSMKELLSRLSIQSFVLDLENEIQELPNLPIFDLKSQDSKTLTATLTKDDDLNSLFDKLSEHGIKVKSMRNEQNRLEELFIRLVKEKDGN
jgi:ABC-2 type transport system ATP-binding protein